MNLPDSVRNLLGSSTEAQGESETDSGTDIEGKATRMDGGQVVLEGEEQISIDLPEDSDVDRERIEAALSGNAGSVNVRGQAGGDTTVTPVASGSDIHITDSAFDLSDWEYRAFLDDQIVNLMDNRVDYNTETGKWILANDDLIPGILIRLKSLMLGQDGLEVSPSDPDSEADQRLADHMRSIYEGENDVEAHVDPSKVLDRILEQNLMNAVFVGRSTDLQHLDVDDLSYVKDGETGEEIYIQHQTGYTTFDLDDADNVGDREISVEVDYTEDQQALEIGKEVLDVRLYRTPPLQAIADDVVNKMQMKRLQGRKAEIASIGGIIIQVNPPAWLSEEDYGNYVTAEDDEFGDEDGRLLELVMAQQIDAALATLEDYQTATVMSIPENWEVTTVELPEMDEPMSEMIRDYNEAISRRLLLPLDLIELKEGPELSRNSMMQMFLDQISGWQGQITDVFDEFSQIQADIHGLNGDVEHHLPSIAAEDEKEILQLFNFAGLLGMSEAESRELANTLEGVDLDTDGIEDMPQDGGPEDPEEREQQMQDMLDQQPEGIENGQNQGPAPFDEGPEPQDDAEASGIEAAGSFSEGDEVETPSGMGVVVEVRTEDFEGPGGDVVEASDDQPAYVVGVEGGVEVLRASDLGDGEIDADVDSPESDLAEDEAEAMLAAGWVPIEAARGDGRFSFPDSWEESDTPARLILLKAWAGMNGQFDCGGDCCKGEMLSSGMSEQAANRFCASMKDRVLGGWEGWRKGAASAAPVRAEHAFSRFETMREAAAHIRDLVERKTPEGHTTEMRKRADVADEAFAVIIRDRDGNFQGSMLIKESETDEGTWKVIGGDDFVGGA